MVRSNSPKKAMSRSGVLASAILALALLGGCESIPDNLVPAPRALPASEPVRADWVEAFWNIINWADVTARFTRARSAQLVVA